MESDRISSVRRFDVVWRIATLATFMIWFGGFTFYASIVVPVGTNVLDSATQQGLITQRVTNWLNLVGLGALVMMLVESILSSGFRSRNRSRVIWSALSIIAVGLIVLFFVHPILDAEVDVEHQGVLDESKFYMWHRIYLWTSTLQWLAGWVWLVATQLEPDSRSSADSAVKSMRP